MVHKILKVFQFSVGTAAIHVPIHFNSFFVQNCGENPIYFKEYIGDFTDATAQNGFLLKAGETFDRLLTADTVSLISTGEDTDVRFLFVEEY